MLGVVKYISTRYDVTKCTLLGASAGGLISVLAACEVDLDTAVERAYQLSLEAGLWDRPLGVLGVWGALIRRWLDDLLPDDAHVRCGNGRVKLVATELPRLQQVYLQVCWVPVFCILLLGMLVLNTLDQTLYAFTHVQLSTPCIHTHTYTGFQQQGGVIGCVHGKCTCPHGVGWATIHHSPGQVVS